GDDAEEHDYPHAVDHQEEHCGDDQEDVPAEGSGEDHHENDPDDQVVGEEEGLFPHESVHVDGQRRGELFDESLVIYEDVGAFFDASGNEVPNDQADGDVGQKFRDGDFEQHGVQQAEGERHDTGGNGDPQGPKD